MLVPYAQGHLVSRIHEDGEILSSEHQEDGTLITARVDEDLAADLATYSV